MRQRRQVAALLFSAMVTVGGGCVQNMTGPVRTPTTYEHKAAATAGTAASSVATVGLAVGAAEDDRAFANYLSILVSNSEDELAATTSTFAAIQPPAASSIEVRAELLDLLSTAADDVAAARIVIRGPGSDLSEIADRLDQDRVQLQDFEERYR